MRARITFVLGWLFAASLGATTLERLSLDDMVQKSAAVVRAKVTGSYSASRGSDIWTFYRLKTLETWKVSDRPFSEVAVPGGTSNGMRQTTAGAPELTVGQEYIVFVWIGRSGLPQVIGLSQGLFRLSRDASGVSVAQRPVAAERMVDKKGQPVEDPPAGFSLVELRSRVARAIGAAK